MSDKVIRELRAGAAKLRALADAATPGPWHRPLNTRYKSIVSAPLPEGERSEWLDGIDPSTGRRERCTVASIPIWSNGRHARKRNGRDLEYIAAMGPPVGLALADSVDVAADLLESYPELGLPHVEDEPCTDLACRAVHAAVAVVRALPTPEREGDPS